MRSVKEECLSKLILFGENSLRHALKEYLAHHHHERNHQGKDNLLLFPEPAIALTNGLEDAIQCRERLGGVAPFLPSGSRMNILTLRPFTVRFGRGRRRLNGGVTLVLRWRLPKKYGEVN